MPTANTLTAQGTVINIVFDGSTNDLDFASYFPNGIRMAGIGFVASADSDILVLKERSDTGKTIAYITGTGEVLWSAPVHAKPYLDYSACTFGTPASCKVIIQLV